MKNRRVYIVIIVVALTVVATIVSFAARSDNGQSPRSQSTAAPAMSAVQTAGRANSASGTTSPAFAVAAAKNANLRNELGWTFGGKSQRGWYLYDLLIGKTLNTQNDPATDDFAATLAGWQKKRGLSPSGVLDENALMAMVSQWQNNRLKKRTPADPDQLVLAPASDFYDPGRAAELRQVERNTYAAYKEMVAAAVADPTLNLKPTEKYFKIISSFRSPDYQEELRRRSPNSGSAGLAVNSPHFTGRALDIYVGGSPVDTKDSNRAVQVNSRAYQWLVRNAERFGFRPYFYEPWHWEYVK